MNAYQSSKNLKRTIFGIILVVLAYSLMTSISFAHAAPAQTEHNPAGEIALGAALAIGIAGGGAALGLGMAASAAIAAITEKEEVFGKALIFVVLIEGIAIFGFLIALQILGEIGKYAPSH